jgi:2-C-methyl-D-erythritol 4-phosphate cytidylyltransferase
MVEWSIEAFRACEAVAAIVVATPAGHEEALGEAGPGLQAIAGGATRAESVQIALELVETELVAIHDAARPLLTPGLVEALVAHLDRAPEAAGVIAATPVTDTIKRAAGTSAAFPSDTNGNAVLVVEATEDRSALWAAQTPQVFRTEELRRALATPPRFDKATDEAMLVEAAGGTILIHPTGPENLKVTTPRDLRLAELLLAERG